MSVLLIVFHPACLNAQESDRSTRMPSSTSSSEEWYRPSPPNRDEKLLVLPVTVDRIVVPISRAVRDVAISKLANAEVMELSLEDCRTLGVPIEADQLIEDAIDKKKMDVKRALRYLRLHPLDGSRYDTTYRAIEDGIAQSNTEIAHWKSLKGRVRPYLVRAVAVYNTENEFFASLCQGSLTVTHWSKITDARNDPLRSHASIILNADSGQLQRAPVVVYLEKKPARLYTEIHILKLGQ